METERNAMLQGWLLGRHLAKYRKKMVRRLLGYLYNDVPLPAIPVVADKPYALIITSPTANGADEADAGTVCILSDQQMILRTLSYENNLPYVTTVKDGAELFAYRIPESGGTEWEYHSSTYTFNNYVIAYRMYGEILWSSHEIRDGDGVYHPGTEPVPVYEEEWT